MAEQDVRMNQFQEAEDAPFIYAEAADGSQVRIKKEDLANIIGKLLNSSQMVRLKNWYGYIESQGTHILSQVQGLVLVRVTYSYAGWYPYWVTGTHVTVLCNPPGYGLSLEMSVDEGNLTIKNLAEGQRKIEVYYQGLEY